MQPLTSLRIKHIIELPLNVHDDDDDVNVHHFVFIQLNCERFAKSTANGCKQTVVYDAH